MGSKKGSKIPWFLLFGINMIVQFQTPLDVKKRKGEISFLRGLTDDVGF